MAHRDDPVAWENLKNLSIDEKSGVLTTIDFGHHEIHEGDHYQVECYETLGSGGTVAFCLTTPVAKEAHMLFAIQSTGETEFNAYMFGSFGADGTSEIPINTNHNYANNSETVVVRNPTIADLGTRFNCKAFGLVNNPANAYGGDVRAEHENILKSGTSRYIYHIKSNSAGNIVSYHGNWYEHTSG